MGIDQDDDMTVEEVTLAIPKVRYFNITCQYNTQPAQLITEANQSDTVPE